MNTLKSVLLLFLIILSPKIIALEHERSPSKVLICGICQNIQHYVKYTVANIETLGSKFADYRVIIYENNSIDVTVKRFKNWARLNPKVVFLSETLEASALPYSRTERIARARNIVLSIAKEPQYEDYEYLIMVDLDFTAPWPVKELIEAIQTPIEWDCISANGINRSMYWDRYAFRSESYPFGVELMGYDWWWKFCNETPLNFTGDRLIPVFSAFCGMAIYKRKCITQFSYSGVVTEDLRNYYKQILLSLPKDHPEIVKYLNFIGKQVSGDLAETPIIFCENNYPSPNGVTCCEHATLHASMALHGFGKFYICPKMLLLYPPQ